MEPWLWLLAGLPLLLGFYSLGQHRAWEESERWGRIDKARKKCHECRLEYMNCPISQKISDTLDAPDRTKCKTELQKLEDARLALKNYLDERAEKADNPNELEKVEMGRRLLYLIG